MNNISSQIVGFFLPTVALATNQTHIRPVSELPLDRPGKWNSVLVTLSNGTNRVDRDPVLESLFKQAFHDALIPAVEGGRPLFGGSTVDPMWIWPLEQRIVQDVFKGDFSGCNVHMHNFKSAQLIDIEVYRTVDLKAAAARLYFHFPILWITGYYQLVRQVFFGFIPAKSRRGDFNIDVSRVSVSVILTLPLERDDEEADVVLDEFFMNMHFGDIAVKFERIAGRFSKLAHLTMNELGMGRQFVNAQKSRLFNELRGYTQAVLNCVLKHPARGIEMCMRRWWETQGWTYPWEYPECHTQD